MHGELFCIAFCPSVSPSVCLFGGGVNFTGPAAELGKCPPPGLGPQWTDRQTDTTNYYLAKLCGRYIAFLMRVHLRFDLAEYLYRRINNREQAFYFPLLNHILSFLGQTIRLNCLRVVNVLGQKYDLSIKGSGTLLVRL